MSVRGILRGFISVIEFSRGFMVVLGVFQEKASKAFQRAKGGFRCGSQELSSKSN